MFVINCKKRVTTERIISSNGTYHQILLPKRGDSGFVDSK